MTVWIWHSGPFVEKVFESRAKAESYIRSVYRTHKRVGRGMPSHDIDDIVHHVLSKQVEEVEVL